jgi:predicted Fe-S protein YdhL (DUF1289 family)
MSKPVLAALLAAFAAVAFVPAHAAPDAERKAAAKEKWDSMTPEEKAAAKDKAKAKWDAMSPEEKKAFLKEHPRLAARMAKQKDDGAASTAK